MFVCKSAWFSGQKRSSFWVQNGFEPDFVWCILVVIAVSSVHEYGCAEMGSLIVNIWKLWTPSKSWASLDQIVESLFAVQVFPPRRCGNQHGATCHWGACCWPDLLCRRWGFLIRTALWRASLFQPPCMPFERLDELRSPGADITHQTTSSCRRIMCFLAWLGAWVGCPGMLEARKPWLWDATLPGHVKAEHHRLDQVEEPC